jgi:hypothetical protein
MEPLQVVSFVLDVLLVVAAIVAYLARPRIGGELAVGLRILLVGVLILGLAHLVETGFVFVILGFIKMRQAFEG